MTNIATRYHWHSRVLGVNYSGAARNVGDDDDGDYDNDDDDDERPVYEAYIESRRLECLALTRSPMLHVPLLCPFTCA